MCKFGKWLHRLVDDARPTSERALILVIAALGGFVVGTLLSPLGKKIYGSYNGSYNEDNGKIIPE